MTDNDDIRWKQRFANYKKALATLKRGLAEIKKTGDDEFRKLGIIQSFEFTQELSWKVLKDFLEYQGGGDGIYGSKDAYRQALNRSIISDGEIWMKMIESRNESSHLYDESAVLTIFDKIEPLYLPCFEALEETLDGIIENSAE